MAHNCISSLWYIQTFSIYHLSQMPSSLQTAFHFPWTCFPMQCCAESILRSWVWCFCESCCKMLCVHSVIGAREQVSTIESQNVRGIESCLLSLCESERSCWIRKTQANICTLCQSLAERTLRCFVSVNKQLRYGKADYEHKETSIWMPGFP